MIQVAQHKNQGTKIGPHMNGQQWPGNAARMSHRPATVPLRGYAQNLLKTGPATMDFGRFSKLYARRNSQFSSASMAPPERAGLCAGAIAPSRYSGLLREVDFAGSAGSEVLRADAERLLTKKKRTDASFGAGRGA